MNKLVAEALLNSKEKLSISAVGARTGITVILAFSRLKPFPVWVAKVTSNASATEALQREHKALVLMSSFSEALGIPKVLGWDDSREKACLIFSGVPGFSEHFTLAPETGDTRDLKRLDSALAWLKRFQESVPESIVRKEMGGRDESSLKLVPSHGDFWSGNLLFADSNMGVIDWEGLAVRNRFHDFFSLFTNCAFYIGKRIEMDVSVKRFLELFFSDSLGSRYVRDFFRGMQPADQELKTSFYEFVAESTRIKGGRYRETWLEISAVLERNGFPEPWSCRISG